MIFNRFQRKSTPANGVALSGEFFRGSPAKVMIDNLKTGVLEHPPGMEARFHPRYLDFAAHYGFSPVACQVRKGNEKAKVETGV